MRYATLRHVLIIAACIVGSCCVAAYAADETPQAREFPDPLGKAPALKYRFLGAPASATSGTRLPLMLCLHGAGERGDDNQRHVGHFRGLIATARAAEACIVVIPQVPSGQLWASYGWGTQRSQQDAQPTTVLRLAKALVDSMVAGEHADPRRIYVVGLSMGGYGTWEFTQRWSASVAACVPVCGGGDLSQAKLFVRKPLWAFHGDQDKTISIDKSQKMIDAIIAAGGAPKFSPYQGVGHGSWGKAFGEKDLIPWLFAQSLPAR